MPIPLLAMGIPIALALAKEYAPDLVGAIVGKGGEKVARNVIQTVESVTGQAIPLDNPSAAEAGAAAALALAKTNPELAVKVCLRLAEIEVEVERAYLEDRSDARDRDIAIRSAGQMNWRADAMVVCAAAALIACVVAAVSDSIGQAALSLVTVIAGGLLTMLKSAFDFEFGSSRGSKAKDGAMAAMASGSSKSS
ncbi:MAG: hypothetical protein ACU0A2_15350 [Cognatishimia sp.]|uniref:hypothetical protein n=1 Tax=Cognatishimia sp. TaxID=2211648 RepID=UPI004058E521